MRVQLPLGALRPPSVAEQSRSQRVGKFGNPPGSGPGDRRFKSDHADSTTLRWVPCWYGKTTVNRPDAGSIPATAAVRSVECEVRSAKSSISSSLPPSNFTLQCALGRAAKVPGFQPGQAGSIPAGHSQTGSVAQRQSSCPLSNSAWVRVRAPPEGWSVPLNDAG